MKEQAGGIPPAVFLKRKEGRMNNRPSFFIPGLRRFGIPRMRCSQSLSKQNFVSPRLDQVIQGGDLLEAHAQVKPLRVQVEG